MFCWIYFALRLKFRDVLPATSLPPERSAPRGRRRYRRSQAGGTTARAKDTRGGNDAAPRRATGIASQGDRHGCLWNPVPSAARPNSAPRRLRATTRAPTEMLRTDASAVATRAVPRVLEPEHRPEDEPAPPPITDEARGLPANLDDSGGHAAVGGPLSPSRPTPVRRQRPEVVRPWDESSRTSTSTHASPASSEARQSPATRSCSVPAWVGKLTVVKASPTPKPPPSRCVSSHDPGKSAIG